MRIFAIPFEEISCTRDLKRKSEGLFIGVWRSWLAHLVWDQRVLCSSHSTPTYERLSVWATFFSYMARSVCGADGSGKKLSYETQFAQKSMTFPDKLLNDISLGEVTRIRLFL